MANPNAFLQSLEKEIAIAIQGEAASRTKNQSNGSDYPAPQPAYSADELAQLIYYSAQSAAETFQADLSRQKNRLTLGQAAEQSPTPGTAPIPLSPPDLLAQFTAILQVHNWVRSIDPHSDSKTRPETPRMVDQPGATFLVNQLYQEETRSFQLHNQLTQDKLSQQRKQPLQENFRRFLEQLPTDAKNHLLTNIPPEIVLQNSNAGQIGVLSWVTRSTVKQLSLQSELPNPVSLNDETVTALLKERAEIARQLKTGTKTVPGPYLEATRKATLEVLNQVLTPTQFPNPKDIAGATIQQLDSLLSDKFFPTEELQVILTKNVADKAIHGTDQNLWAIEHERLTAGYASLPQAKRAEIESTTGTLQPALASALAAVTEESPTHKNTLFQLGSLLTTGQLPVETTLETVNAILILQRQLETDRKSLQVKIDPSLIPASQAVFDPAKEADANPALLNKLKRFKAEGDALVTKLELITRTQNNLTFANTDSPFSARLERAVGLTQLHAVLRQGLSHYDISTEVISLLRERQSPLQSLQNLHVAYVVEKPDQHQNGQGSKTLQKIALQAEKENNPRLFQEELENTIHSLIGKGDKATARQTLTDVAEVLRYLPLQPPVNPRAVQITEQRIIGEIIRHAKNRHDHAMEAQFTNPSETDLRVITTQAQREVERKSSDKIFRTIRKNAESLDGQRLALAICFQSPADLAAAWTRKGIAEASLNQLHETKRSQIATQIESLETALSITEKAKELKTIADFKVWITETHNRALQSAQADYAQDPFNLGSRNRVQELLQFTPELEQARTGAQDPAGNLDIRAVWDILTQNKTNLQRQIHRLKVEREQFGRHTISVSDPEAIQLLNGTTSGQTNQNNGTNGINSLSHAFDDAFRQKDMAGITSAPDQPAPDQPYQWTNPFQGHPLEAILDAGARQRQLQSKTQELAEYWSKFLGKTNLHEENRLPDQGAEIQAAAKLLLLHEMARSETKPDLPSEINQIWLSQATHIKRQRHLNPQPAEPDKKISLISV
jgi:hypothetical protein